MNLLIRLVTTYNVQCSVIIGTFLLLHQYGSVSTFQQSVGYLRLAAF